MRSFLPTVVGLCLAVTVMMPSSVSAATTSQSILWGAFIQGAPFDMNKVSTFESHAGKKTSIIPWGQPWKMNGQFQAFQTKNFQAVRDRGELPMLTWGTWELGAGINQSSFQLADVTAGKYDTYITQWAQAAKAWGHPFFLRLDHEMNGWWYPWNEQLNGNKPGDYVRMWRHVHDIFSRVGANNASWVWCPNIVSPKSTPTAEVYPGGSYVDWTCMDGYNWGTDRNNSWQTFTEVVSGSAKYGGHNTYEELLKVAPDKPIMIGETASSEHGGNKPAWIKDMLTTQLPTHFPMIKAIIWNEWTDDPAKTWPIESSSSAQAAFKAGIASGTYATNQFATATGKIGALSTSTPAASTTSTSSAPASAPAPTGTSTSTSATLSPVADTYTSSTAPTSAAGGSSVNLRADKQGTDTTFMRFDLSKLSGKTITSAKLKVHASTEAWAGSGATFDVKFVATDDWKEQFMTLKNTVPVSSTVLGSLADPITPGAWYSITLSPTALQSSAGTLLSMAINARSGDVLIIDSRESGAATAPQLVVTYK
jgi:hypothetical protein